MAVDDLPPIRSSNNAPRMHSPPAPCTNVKPTTDNKQHDPTAKQLPADNNKLNTKKLRLPHPCSLDVLPSPTNKWSATTHSVKGWSFGFLGYHIFYKHFYFHLCQVLDTNAFALRITATTVGDGGDPWGSTKLDNATGHNFAMSLEEYTLFAILVLGRRPGETHGTTCSTGSFVNMLLEDFTSLVNLTTISPSTSLQIKKHWQESLPASPSYSLERMSLHLLSLIRCGERTNWCAKNWEDRAAVWL